MRPRSPASERPWGPDPVAQWLALFVCPACRGDLAPVDGGLRCAACMLRYPVRDGVPWLTAELAEPDPR